MLTTKKANMDCTKQSTLCNTNKEIVISGIAGRFPNSDNMKQLQDNLFNEIDLASNDNRRWNTVEFDMPSRLGKINNLEKFDAQYFDISSFEAQVLDPMTRMLLEHTYEAIIDAGVNPAELHGTNTGVFIGACYSSTFNALVYDKPQVAEYVHSSAKFFLANKISSWLNVSGPSYVVDTACSSSLFALAHAYTRIKNGECNAAIVAGVNLCLHPYITYQFFSLGVLSADGYCRPFDEKASGYMRSDTVAVLLLQKAKDARRIYATCVNVKTNCDGFKEEGITYPSFEMQKALLEEFYEECKIAPSEISYMEAHGTGTIVGDPVEVKAIDQVFCKNRNNPLLMSSIKSNLGHSEPASGLCQIAKVLIAMETGKIPATLHFKSPRNDLTAVIEGRIKIVNELTPWNGGYAGVNSFGFGGANCHVLLKSNPKNKIKKLDELPRLVIVSGRTKEAVKTILDDVHNRPIDVEYIALLHSTYNKNIERHSYRGYTIVELTEDHSSINKIECYSNINKQICFLFPGRDVIWHNIGKELMELPIIVKTIHKCDEALKPYGICVTDILLNKKEITCNDSIKLFMAIISIQIAMVDLLLHIGIVPDYVLGQSIGELLCGYVDELFTLKETIVMAYYMSVAFEKLKVEHCNYISAASNQYSESTRLKLQEYLNQIVPYKSMKSYKYSKKWLNTLLPHSKIYNSFTQLSAAEYYAYSAVYSSLEELLPIIPENVVVIEIVSYNNWQFFMKKVLDSNYISLFQHGQGNNIDSILKGIGNLYNIGCQPQVANLYPPIQFPVSRGTPMISPLIKWDHSENCYVATFISEKKPNIRETIEEITFKDSSLKYMYDHVIDRRILLPASGYLFLIWKMIGTLSCCDYKNIPIIFEDVNFLRATHLSKTTTVKLTLSIQNGSNQFEISEETTVVVTGKVWIPNDIANHKVLIHNLNEPKHNVTEYMNTKDIYKELRLRGYHYSGIFQGLKSASISTKVGHIRWSDNWTAFIDNMLQMKILLLDSRNLFVPTRIRKLVIDPEFHMKQIQTTPDERANFPVRVYDSLDVIISGGIEIYGVMATNIPRQNTESIHDEYCFIAHCDRAVMSLTEIIQMSAHISLECNPVLHANFIELIEDVDTVTEQDLLSTICYDILNNLPLIEPNITLVATANRFKTNELSPNINLSGNLTKDKNVLMIIVFKLLTKNRSELIDTLLSTLKEGSFVLSRENLTESYNYTLLQQYKLNIVLEKRTEKEAFVLLRKTQSIVPQEVIYINNSDFSWINKLKSSLNMDDKLNASTRTILVADDFECGILGFINCLRKELNKTDDKIRCVFIQDENAPKFSLQDSVYINQLQLDLPINILRPNKVWGSYRHLPLPQLEPKFVQHGYVVQSVRGDLSKLRWIEGPIFPDYKQENLVRVVYASLNFKDIMIATGRIPLDISGKKAREIDSFLGCEFVGFNAAGKRIMGISTLRGITNLIVADPQLCWIIPDKWTLEDAATVPVAYCTSCYALYTCGKLKKGEKILIHSGTGAVGQSAIYLALFEGCEIFTTVGTPEKRNFIREKFPSIPEDHIGNSRDTSFEQMISQKTRGRGVDIVLNSLAEDKLQASIRCLARGGRFLEIGKYDLISNSTINLKEFSKGISFYGVLLDRVFISTDERRKIHIHNLLNNMIQRGAVEPLKREVFEQHEVETAFKHMAAAKHIGKVIIKIRTEEEVVDAPILAYPQYFCNEHKSYIILGGLGGFGLELTDWLILRGARKIILISRNGIKNGYQQSRVELWKSYGVNVQIMTGIDASTHEDCASILRFANKLGPVDAIFNLAVVLNDNIFTNQTPETFEESFQSKARATKQLDHLSRKMCPHLRHFVVFSSVSCGKGNPGQTNYGMANSIMERICEKRVQDGLPGMAIQWGAIGDVGLVADMQQNNKELVISGTLQQRISSCLESLNTFLMQNRPIVSSMIVATKSKVSGDIAHIVMNIMGLKTLKGVGEHVLLSELGMDSMMGLEIKQTIEREFSIFFTIQELRNLTFAKLKEIANKDTYDKQNAEKQLDTNNSQHIKIFNLFQLISDLDIFSDICIELSTQREISRNQVFLLPGIEGFANVYNSIAPKIKAPAICLQHSSINIPESAHSVIQSATDLLPHILSKLTDSTEFVIGAYSYGSLIAIEIVKQLEAKNFRGRLILIDGAPKYLQIVQETLFPFTNSQEFQILVLKQMTDVFNIPVSELNISEISKYVTWEEKLNIFIKNLKSEITNTISSDSIKIFCTTIYKHLIAVQEYDTSSLISIRSPIILLKATNPLLPSVEEDYGLNKISKNVQIHYVDSNHISIINTEQVAAAINGVIREEQ